MIKFLLLASSFSLCSSGHEPSVCNPEGQLHPGAYWRSGGSRTWEGIAPLCSAFVLISFVKEKIRAIELMVTKKREWFFKILWSSPSTLIYFNSSCKPNRLKCFHWCVWAVSDSSRGTQCVAHHNNQCLSWAQPFPFSAWTSSSQFTACTCPSQCTFDYFDHKVNGYIDLRGKEVPFVKPCFLLC